MKILLVEDDERIAAALTEALTDHYYVVDVASDGEQGFAFAQTFPYELLILDVMLPKLDGIAVCRKIRQTGHKMPVLMLTARDTYQDKVTGLDVGADDYVVKPFDLNELLARVRALLRRGTSDLTMILEFGYLQLNPNTYEVRYDGEPLHLTPKEYRILELLLRHRNRTFSKSEIIDYLWSFTETPNEETVKVHIRSLRQKLKSMGAKQDLIETVYGLGYRLKH
ncbi:response regulator transcription factor [Pseudanabaena mucicola]|uniref:Response regulator transcription factor n=1 Tax=Pseudanabaena mucicola FACHB-723 TaxID=2692860 RepID=A0ABR7ZWA7_9CYAN|nr:response regulator transcription factor [Pseudanabaena mucicola]MBD2187809.1 response regulator transcription factor [Pseudanabaena mucicola FACHB-723]